MALEVTVEELDAHTAVVTFRGPLTLGATDLRATEAELRRLLERGFLRLVFDLGAVPYCDSAGLGLLVHTYAAALERVGLVRLCAVSERVAKVLRMTNTDTLLPMDPDRGASLAALPVRRLGPW